MTAAAKTPQHKDLGDRLRAAREKTGKSQETFAPLVGLSRRHLIRVEQGWNRATDVIVRRIADLTDTPVAELYGFAVAQEAAPSGEPFRGDGRGARRTGRAASARAADSDGEAAGGGVTGEAA